MIESPAKKELFEQLTEVDILNGTLSFCQYHQYGFAVWRLPDEGSIKLIIDDTDNWLLEDKPIEELNEGFIFAPFKKDAQKYFLKSRIKIDLSKKKVEHCVNDNILLDLSQYLERFNEKPKKHPQNHSYQLTPHEATNYKQLVRESVEVIKSGTFLKVVPSRFKPIQLGEQYNMGSHWFNLENRYKKSFISLTYTPDTNIWLGATPEILIKTQGDIFKTVALAGTQKYDDTINISDVAWTQKEIEEQALVSRYIINSFKKIRLREFDEHGPKTVIAGNLIHLKTEFTVDMKATGFPQLGSVMLDLLHPTSAICGMPLESAYEFIQRKEGYDRKFFAGYLGPVNNNDLTAIFVNLRCMEIKDKEAILYAGAGVTEDSNPEKEWLETEMKMNTLLNALEN